MILSNGPNPQSFIHQKMNVKNKKMNPNMLNNELLHKAMDINIKKNMSTVRNNLNLLQNSRSPQETRACFNNTNLKGKVVLLSKTPQLNKGHRKIIGNGY